MRKVLTIAALTLVFNLASKAQKQETVEGNGKITTREVPVKSFNELKVSGVFELKLSQGDKESVKIAADENLQEYINVSNSGSSLVIDMDKLKNNAFKGKNTITVYVTFKSLKELDLSMVGNTMSEEILSFDDLDFTNKSVGNVKLSLSARKINIDNNSVGNVTLTGKADDAVINNKAVGALQAADFVVQTMKLDNESVGAAEVNAAKHLDVKESWMGKVTNKGAGTVKKRGKTNI